MKEQLSALVDGEADDLERERTLRALGADPELRGTWERYHLASTALRRELELVMDPGLANRIRERLEQDPPDAARGLLTPKLLKFSAGVAIAASVAAVALLNLSTLVGPSAPTVTARATPAARTLVAETRPAAPAQQRVLNPYLVHHAEFSSASGVTSMSAYARVVGRDSASAESTSAE